MRRPVPDSPCSPLSAFTAFAALALALAGCPESHSMPGADAGPGGADTGPTFPDAPLPHEDAHAPAPDAPSRCPLGAFDAFCTTTGNAAVPVGVPYDLEVFLGSIDGCYCGEEIDCTGTLTADGAIELTAAVCTESVCDACLLRTPGVCHLPPLSEGTYAVRINGERAFDLRASSVTPFLPVDTCVTVPDGGCAPMWPPVPMHVDTACVDSTRAGIGAPIPVEIVNGCATCAAAAGPCETIQTSPTSFEVVPQELLAGCDIACPAICMEARHTCWLPALEAGTYSVRVRGIDATLSVTVGDPSGGARQCVGLLTGGGGG